MTEDSGSWGVGEDVRYGGGGAAPGAPLDPAPEPQPGVGSRLSYTRNWEVDRVAEKTTLPAGTIARLSVAVLLDGKPMRTPAKAILVVPTKPLAEAIDLESCLNVLDPFGDCAAVPLGLKAARLRQGRGHPLGTVDKVLRRQRGHALRRRTPQPQIHRVQRRSLEDHRQAGRDDSGLDHAFGESHEDRRRRPGEERAAKQACDQQL